MTNPYYKEFLTNNIVLPSEIVNIIKSYAFYDIKTANLLKNAKLTKRKVNNFIREALSNSTFDMISEISLDQPNNIIMPIINYVPIMNLIDIMEMAPPGGWGFGFINHPTETVQLQGYNCLKCGNYKLHHTFIEKICCFCQEDEEEE